MPVAYRWKTQINENAKQHAFYNQLSGARPQRDRRLDPDGDGERFAAVFLTDADQHPRQRERAELTAKLIAPSASAVIEVETEGETRVERLLWAVMLGDLVSFSSPRATGSTPDRSSCSSG